MEKKQFSRMRLFFILFLIAYTLYFTFQIGRAFEQEREYRETVKTIQVR